MEAHVLGTLQYLRETVNTAGSFSTLPGSAGIAMGSIGLTAAGVVSLPAFASFWLAVWLAAAGLAVPVGCALMTRKAQQQGVTLHRGAARRFVLCLCPAFAAAAVLTWALAQANAADLIPGTWLLLYGAGIAAASVLSIPLIGAMGLAFMLLGAFTLFAPLELANLLLGAGFGGLHVAFGALLARRDRG